MNKARALMNLPQEACLASDDEEVHPPAVKRAKTGNLVEQAMLREPLREVPSQVVSGQMESKQAKILLFSFFCTLHCRL